MTLNKFIFFCPIEYYVLKSRITVNHIFRKTHYIPAEFPRVDMAFVVLEIRYNCNTFRCKCITSRAKSCLGE